MKKDKNKRIIVRELIKKAEQGKVVFSKEEPRSKYFKSEWGKAKWI